MSNNSKAAVLLFAVLLFGAARAAPLDLQGDPLPDRALARMGNSRLRPGGRVYRIFFTPDSKTMVTWTGTLSCWDAATGRPVSRFDNPLREPAFTC